jgi:tetratricopeptide (TPR) repeat protein
MPRLPRPLSGCDIKSLPLSPTEAFLLSRLDATVNERDLSLITGLSLTDVASVLDRLFQLGAIDFIEDHSPPRRTDRPPPGRTTSVPPPSESGRSATAVPRGAFSSPALSPLLRQAYDNPIGATPPLYDPAELDEEVEIEPERKRRVLDLFYRLEELTYYQLLGLAEEADKKQVKNAYYALAPDFHPDKYFRKRLGSYKAKIEAIFSRLTLAHDVLTSKQRRAEYDGYLEQTHKNRTMAALLDQTPRDVALVSAAVDESAAAVIGVHPPLRDGAPPSVAGTIPVLPLSGRYASDNAGLRAGEPSAGTTLTSGTRSAEAASAPPPLRAPAPIPAVSVPAVSPPLVSAPLVSAASVSAPPVSAAPVSAAPVSAPGAAPASAPPSGVRSSPESHQSRREALARKLKGGVLRRSAPPPPSPSNDPVLAQRAAEALRARFDAALAEARRSQLQRYLEIGRSALDRKDYAGAANAYRIAASLAPDDREVQATCDEAMRLAAAALAEGYWKQAQYEENQGRWTDAALSYAKTCTGRPGDARAHERVAFATLKSSTNTRRAVEFARKAVELEPNSADLRLTLSRAYAAAGFEKSAQGEAERALALSPNDPKIREYCAMMREHTQRDDKSG